MLKELYTAALGMVPQQTRLEVLSNNIANANTVGFKRESAFERSLISAQENLNNTKGDVEHDDTPTDTFTDYSQGATERTGNQFDFAIDGKKGYFMVEDRDGNQQAAARGRHSLSQHTVHVSTARNALGFLAIHAHGNADAVFASFGL